ncbi:MAG TPA: GNAT family protein [Puia sp.]|nr:GNAT family protein [Puia sp.]
MTNIHSFLLPEVFPARDINGDLAGEFAYLLPLAWQDYEEVRRLARDSRIWEFNRTLTVNENYDHQFDDYFKTAMELSNQSGQSFTIHNSKNDRIIGMSRMHSVNPPAKGLEIGHTWYLPEFHGKVYNRECKLLLLQFVFERLGFMRVQFRVASQNIRSQKAVTKIGGVREGELRKSGFRNDGTLTGTVYFSIIDEEWPEKKQRLIDLIASSEC